MSKHKAYSECPGSVSGHDTGSRDGKCTWCGKKVTSAAPMPRLTPRQTDLDVEYRRKYDPNYGSHPLDNS
jgi:hypothetical protein